MVSTGLICGSTILCSDLNEGAKVIRNNGIFNSTSDRGMVDIGAVGGHDIAKVIKSQCYAHAIPCKKNYLCII